MNRITLNKFITWSLVTITTMGAISPLDLYAFVPNTPPGEHPVSWSDLSFFDMSKVLNSQYASGGNLYDPNIPDSTLDLIMNDADGKISPDFHIPSILQESVRFWLKIYTQWTSRQAILVDSNHLGVVYEVIDMRKMAQTARNRMVYEILSQRRVKATVEKYKAAFLSLAKNSHPKHPTHEQSVILEAAKKLPHPVSFMKMKKDLKVMRGQRDHVIKGLLVADEFLPKMETIFQKMNIPTELTRITMVESSFNLFAGSRVGAFGIWQIMPQTGKGYKLTIDPTLRIDERLSPLKSTFAAGKLLLFNYKYLGAWPLAVIAYNHGHAHLPRFKKGQYEFSKISHLFNPDFKGNHLGFASRNYYCEFLALLHAETYQKLVYGESPLESTIKPIAFEQLKAPATGISLAKLHGLSLQEFKLYNADIKDLHMTLPEGFWIAVTGKNDNLMEVIEHNRRGGGIVRSIHTKKVAHAKHKLVLSHRHGRT